MFHSVRLTRRQVLKVGIAGASMTAMGGLASQVVMAEDFIRGGASVSRTTGQPHQAVSSVCGLCTAHCGILGFVEEDRLVKIEGNPRDPNSKGRLCARGQAGLNRIYDPDRVLFPMERVGQRGENNWARITWEQAYDKLESKLRDAQARDGQGLVLHTGMEGSSLLARRFAGAFDSGVLLDETCLHNLNRETANRLSIGTDEEVVDVANARYILNFGGNPYESHAVYVPFVQRLVDARLNGAKLVTFDPRLSLTAGRSDEWFSILPGTDGYIALAMANAIVQQGLHNREFLSDWTDISSGELAEMLSPYTPELAESVSGMRADDIRRLATEFAQFRPAVAFFGGGVSHQKGAVSAQRAVILLNAVVGNVGVRGGYCSTPGTPVSEVDPMPSSPISCPEAVQVVADLLQGSKSAGVYITSLANPAYSWPAPEAFREMLKDESRVQYLVSIDTNITETSALADLVLPAATYLESWGLETPPPQNLVPYVLLRQPVVRPLGESISVDDILLTMGTRLEGEASQYFAFPRIEGYLDAAISGTPAFSEAGGLAGLREHGVWYDLAASPSYRAESGGFATQSGKLDLRSGLIDPVPEATARAQVSGSYGRDGEELTLVTYRPNVHSGDYSANCWLLAEIAHDNRLLLNPATAERIGIHQDQRVRVTSAVGALDVAVRITEGIHPQVVALASGFGHESLGRNR